MSETTCPCTLAAGRKDSQQCSLSKTPTTISNQIYFDNNSTTLISERTLAVLNTAYKSYGYNCSSIHVLGEVCHDHLENCRKQILSLIHASEESTLIFTSGATESNNLAIHGIMRDNPNFMIVASTVEHESVLNLLKQEYNYILVPVDKMGFIYEKSLINALHSNTPKIGMVSLIAAQNEIGTIQNLNKIIPIIRGICGPDTVIHVDATQLFGKYNISIKTNLGDPDLVSGSAHKFHGPKGTGFLYVKNASILKRIHPLMYGGGQEMNIRPGTENLPNIMAMTAALTECVGDKDVLFQNVKKVAMMKEYIYNSLIKSLGKKYVTVNGDIENGLYNTLNLTFYYRTTKYNMSQLLTAEGICVTSASACTKYKPSHVLDAIGIDQDQMKRTIRISLSRYNDMSQCKKLLEVIVKLYNTTLQQRDF
jgi:cysteine desulfurase